MIDTAFILAAGRGERLKPITNFIPKPLVQVGGQTLIQKHLAACNSCGFSRVIINHAHLGEQIVEHCKQLSLENNFEFELVFSAETSGGLETAGGIINALELIDGKTFALINADIYSDYNFSQLRKRQLTADLLGHLVLVTTPGYKDKHDFYFDKNDQAALCYSSAPSQDSSGYTFSGISILKPELFKDLKKGKRPLAPLLRQAMENDKITAEHHPGQWHDVGTPERLKKLRKEINLQFID